MGVSRSAYYDWLQRKPTSRDQVDSQLIPVIQSLFAKGRATYGTRRIRQSLEKQNLPVGRRRLGRLMRAAGLVCKTKRTFKVTTDSKHLCPVGITCRLRIICWIGILPYNRLIKLMLATSLISAPKRAGYAWQLSSTCIPGKSWAGQWPGICGHRW
jgi:transposase InsO family protein